MSCACNCKRYFLTAIVVFIAVAGLDFLIHGHLLMGMYQDTARLWIPQDQANMLWITTGQLLYALIISSVFTWNYENKGLSEGIRFGLAMGALIATVKIGTQSFLPIPLMLTLSWCGAELIKGLAAGIVCALLYRH